MSNAGTMIELDVNPDGKHGQGCGDGALTVRQRCNTSADKVRKKELTSASSKE